MKVKTRKQTEVLDKQLSRLVKKSVEGCTPSTDAWPRIRAAIQSNQPPTMTPTEAKPALSLSD